MARPIAFLALAALWTGMLLAGGRASGFDPALLNAVYVGGYPAVAAIARLLTGLGGWAFLTAATAVAAAILLYRRHIQTSVLLVGVVLLGRLAVELQKSGIGRLRPVLHEQLVLVTSSSFPSGHAANATITCLAIALLLGRRPLWIGAAAALAVAIGISRVMLGVHWPSDVVAGWSFGLLWLAAALWLFPKAARPPA